MEQSYKAREDWRFSTGCYSSFNYLELDILMAKKGLYHNMNKRKKAGTSRSKKNSTVTKEAYSNMKAGFPKKKK